MKIRIDKTSEVPVHLQLREQIIFQISTGELPIGYAMPSVRELERRLGIHRNTISQAYAELVEERWLVKERGRRLVVVHRCDAPPTKAESDLEAVIEHLLVAARMRGVSPAQLVDRIIELAMAAPPDHLLIVEPEHGLGEIMRKEIQQVTGRKAECFPVSELKRRRELLAGAALLVPTYLMDLLDFVPQRQLAAIVPLMYSPVSSFQEHVRNLTRASVVGMLSVSQPGMKTLAGQLAEAIGVRHSLCLYWMEWPPHKAGVRCIHRLTIKPGTPREPIRVPKNVTGDSETAPAAPARAPIFDLTPVSLEDLKVVDLLFCDSITYDAVQHPNRVKYQLLSEESLREIAGMKLGTKEG